MCLTIIENIGGQSKAPRSELMVELNSKRAWVLSATAQGLLLNFVIEPRLTSLLRREKCTPY